MEAASLLIQRVGFPITVTLILLFQLVPKIDHGIAIADKVDGELAVLMTSCGGKP